MHPRDSDLIANLGMTGNVLEKVNAIPAFPHYDVTQG